MKREFRDQLNKLSKEVFGTTSRWQKIVNNGVAEPMERDREVMVPKANGNFVKKIFTDKKSVIKRYTADEVCKLMLDLLAARNASKVRPVESTPTVVVPADSLEGNKALDELAAETENLGLEFK